MMLDKLGDAKGLEKASVTLKQRQDALKQYCSDNGLSYKADRTAVVGYNRDVAGNVRKSLTSAKNSDILKTENNSDLGVLKTRLQNVYGHIEISLIIMIVHLLSREIKS